MTLNRKYFDLLEHLEQTHTVDEMWGAREDANLISLRHDIDHSLDVALEMAYWEHDRGFRATYYLLNSAPYWEDPRFDEKVRQLIEFGHEVGLHFNSVANWLAGRANSPKEDYLTALRRLRALGGSARGTAAHGDRLCYTYGAPNFWMFASEDPNKTGDMDFSAEGISVADPNYQITRPESATLARDDGSTIDLWASTLEECETEFLAHRVNWDRYYTDSGGNWTRSPDPLTVSDIGLGKTMILVHPIHWRAPPKQIFVLSPARSGSTWLANMTEAATNARGLHEVALNSRLKDEDLIPEKRTNHQIDALLDDKKEITTLLSERRDWFDQSKDDVLECNVYLPLVLEQLKALNDDATYVSLRRNPEQVLLSLYNRGWYETADDNARPTMPVDGWNRMSQIEKIAHYIRYCRTQAELTPDVTIVDLDKVTSDMNALASFYRSLGLTFYPLLAEPVFREKRNAGKFHDVTSVEELPKTDQQSIERLLPSRSAKISVLNSLAFEMRQVEERLDRFRWGRLPFRRSLTCLPSSRRMSYKTGRATVQADAAAILQIGQKAVRRRKRTLPAAKASIKFDIPSPAGTVFLLDIKDLKVSGHWQLALIVYGSSGERLELKRLEARLEDGSQKWRFRIRASGIAFRIALSAPVSSQKRQISFRSITLDRLRNRQEMVQLEPALFRENLGIIYSQDIEDPCFLKDVLRLAKLGFGRITLLLPSTSVALPTKLSDIGVNVLRLSELRSSKQPDASPPLTPTVFLSYEEHDSEGIDNAVHSALEPLANRFYWSKMKSLDDDQITRQLSQKLGSLHHKKE